MTQQEAKNYIEGAFQALKDRGWFLKTGLVPTGVTDREIAEFEAESELKLPHPAESIFEVLPDGL